MVNAWMAHVKTVSAANKGKSLKEILKMAKKTYKRSPGVVHKKKHKKTRRKTEWKPAVCNKLIEKQRLANKNQP